MPARRRRRFRRLVPHEGLATLTPAMETAGRYFEWVFDALVPHLSGRVLEVGSGFGVFSTVLARRHGAVVATDQDPAAVAVLERRLAPFPQARVRRLDILDDGAVAALAREGPLDAVVSMNVLEHVEDDVRALANMARLVRPGGTVIAFVPALEALYGSLDALAGHFRRYDRPMLDARFRAAALRPRALRYFNLLGALGWFVNACVVPQPRLDTTAMNGQVALYDRFVVRLSAALERRFTPPFGQSLIGVAERP